LTVPVVRFTVREREPAADAAADMPADALTVGHPGRPYTVVYDGHCNVCKKLVAGLIRWDTDGKLEILPSQTPGLKARFPWIPDRAYLESVQVIRSSDGKTWQGAAAVEQLFDVLPKGKLISWIFSIPFARPLAEKSYRWFARNRYHLGCGEHCQLHPLDVDFGDAPHPPGASRD
jgi:predicted DCC family thiol-disulfide oxidoreductase YuxK